MKSLTLNEFQKGKSVIYLYCNEDRDILYNFINGLVREPILTYPTQVVYNTKSNKVICIKDIIGYHINHKGFRIYFVGDLDISQPYNDNIIYLGKSNNTYIKGHIYKIENGYVQHKYVNLPTKYRDFEHFNSINNNQWLQVKNFDIFVNELISQKESNIIQMNIKHLTTLLYENLINGINIDVDIATSIENLKEMDTLGICTTTIFGIENLVIGCYNYNRTLVIDSDSNIKENPVFELISSFLKDFTNNNYIYISKEHYNQLVG